jgi:hypothetical protein
MKKLTLYILLLFIVNLTKAQVQWAKQIGSPSITQGEYGQIISDGSNTYMIGSFGGVLYLPNDTIYADGSEDIFIAKFDANGDHLWTKKIGGNSSSTMDGEYANGVYDPVNQCIYLSGHFVNNFYFPGVGYISGNSDIFLAKMDLDGNFIWAKKAGGNGFDNGQVYVNPYGKIYLLTMSSDSAYFDGFHIGPGGGIIQYNTSGACLSASIKYSANPLIGYKYFNLNFIGNDLVFNGYTDTTPFVLDTVSLNGIGGSEGFIARTDSMGKVKWVHIISSSGTDYLYAATVNNNNNISFIATISDTVNFLGNLIPSNGYDILIVTLNENGGFKWAKNFKLNSNNIVMGADIKSDSNSNIFATGFFSGLANFDNIHVTSTTSEDMFLAKLDTSGNCLSYSNFGKATGSSLTIDNTNNIYVCGNFSNTVSIGSNSFTMYGGSSDIYLAKFNASMGNNTRTAPNNSLIIYANPTKGTCNITIPDDLKRSPNLTLMIYNAQGSLIQKQPIQQLQDKIKLNLEAESKGVYNVSLGDGYRMYYGKIVFD